MKMAKARKRKKSPAKVKSEINRLIKRLVALSPDQGTKLRAKQIQDRLAMPMRDVLAKVPGLSVASKCRALGISRQAYYYWVNGMSRPNPTQAARIAKITGINAGDIRGETRLTPTKPSSLTSVAAR